MLHTCSYGCLSLLVLPILLLVSWRYINDEPAGAKADLEPTGDSEGQPAHSGQVQVPGPELDHQRVRLEDSLAAQLPSFRIESSNTQIGNLPMEQLVLEAREVELNVRELLRGEKASINSFGSAEVSLSISGDALRQELLPMLEANGLRKARIEFGADSVKITAMKKVKLLGSIKIAAKARFQVLDESAIGLQITELESGPLNLGVSSLKLDFRQELPPLNLGGSFARVVIDGLVFRAGRLHVEAHAVQLPEGAIPRNAIDVL